VIRRGVAIQLKNGEKEAAFALLIQGVLVEGSIGRRKPSEGRTGMVI